jgi:glucokinase
MHQTGPTGAGAQSSAGTPSGIGFDVGGSSIKAGRVDREGRILSRGGRDLGEGASFEQLLSACAELFRELGGGNGLGIGVPGLLDLRLGGVTDSPNLPYLDGQPLVSALETRLSLPRGAVRLENDANAAALGEDWLGSGKELSDFLFVTLGTGVGGGLILSGKLYRGFGMAGEIGHVKVAREGPRCGCERIGCLETFASATAARRRAEAAGLPRGAPGDLRALDEAAARSPGPERDLLEAIGFDLGLGLATALNLLDLRAFVIGGGFAATFPRLEPGIRRGLSAGSYGQRLDGVLLRPASLGTDAGWLGAARLGLSLCD